MTRRKNGTYQEQMTLITNGEKKQKFFYGKTQAEIKGKIMAYKGEQVKGRLFSVVAEEWKEEHFARVAYKTTECYSAPLKRLIAEFGDSPIRDITSQGLNKFIVRVSKQGYSLRTVRAHIDILNMIFNFALLSGDAIANPTIPIRPPKGLHTTKRDMPSDTDITKVKNGLNAKFGLFAYMLLYTGCRKGEALALQYEDIDFDNKTISIDKSLYCENNRPKIKSPKTEAGKRKIILLDKLADKLPKGKGYIFAVDGKPLTRTMFNKRWAAYKKETGITFTPHQLRHAFATILFEAGIDEKMAQDIMGHASLSVMRDIYTHIRMKKKEEAADKLNEFLNRT